MKRIILQDNTSWPIDADGQVEWTLRYGSAQPVALSAASVLRAYAHLLDPAVPTETAVQKVRMLKRAVRDLANGRGDE